MKLILLLIFTLQFLFAQSLPELNSAILKYATVNMGKTVGQGECWDLAAIPLDNNNAKWDGQYSFGKEYNPLKSEALPGDIIQFYDCEFSYKKGSTTYTATMELHTAVIYKVKSKTVFEIAHQNNSEWGRKIGVSEIDINTMKEGKMIFFRPTK